MRVVRGSGTGGEGFLYGWSGVPVRVVKSSGTGSEGSGTVGTLHLLC